MEIRRFQISEWAGAVSEKSDNPVKGGLSANSAGVYQKISTE